jgi:hypothetical protein
MEKRLIRNMKRASILGIILPTFDGKFNRMIISDPEAKIRQIAVFIFIGCHNGNILLNRVILNSQPIRSAEHIISTIIKDIHIKT